VFRKNGIWPIRIQFPKNSAYPYTMDTLRYENKKIEIISKKKSVKISETNISCNHGIHPVYYTGQKFCVSQPVSVYDISRFLRIPISRIRIFRHTGYRQFWTFLENKVPTRVILLNNLALRTRIFPYCSQFPNKDTQLPYIRKCMSFYGIYLDF